MANKNGRYKKVNQKKESRVNQAGPENKHAGKRGRDIIRQDEHRKIAPGHPNTGRR